MLTDLADYLNLGQRDTGLPGSQRIPRILGNVQTSVDSKSSVTLDPQKYENDTNMVFFAEQVFMSGTADDTEFMIEPTNGPAWMNRLCSQALIVDNATGMWILPEPYPLTPRSSFRVTAANRNTSTARNVNIGFVGYFETEPKYRRPRLAPYVMSSRIDTALTNGSDTRFDEAGFYAGFPFWAQMMRINPYQTGTTTLLTNLLLIRYAIKKQTRVMDGRVPATVLMDLRLMGIPMFDAKLDKGQGFQIEIENITGQTLNPITAAVVGYTRLH